MNWKILTTIKDSGQNNRIKSIIDNLLKQRGLMDKKKIKVFFDPPLPEDIKPETVGIKSSQLDKAVKRIKQAKTKQELVYIYGDYDTDGVSATTILWENLHRFGLQVMPYIPTRVDKTRGLSRQGIDAIIAAAETKPDLIITVDNGITAFKACQYARKLGIDIIITDHHQPKKIKNKTSYPQCSAVVHSIQIAGAGVAWFLAQTLASASDSLDVTALGTIADMVPLLGPNRSLVVYGLKALSKTKRPGLKALAKLAGLDLANLETYQVGYVLSPRLNAMARLEHAIDSVRLLCTRDPQKARQLASVLETTNQHRQDLTVKMIEHAEQQVDQSRKILFVASSSYHEGVVGLVAGRLAEKFNRPAVVIAVGKSFSKASARSIPGFNLVKLITSMESDLINLGGHEMAAGFTLKTKNLKIIRQKLENYTETVLTAGDFQPVLEVESLINLDDITWDLYRRLEKFKPFGMDNPDPVFATKKVKLAGFRVVGKDQNHLKLTFKKDFLKLDAIAFNKGYLADQLNSGQLVNIAYTIDSNCWNGQQSLQLKIKDLQSS